MSDRATAPSLGGIEKTLIELHRIERAAAFRRRHRDHARLRLRHSDEVLRLVEECRVRGFPVVPAALWSEVVRLVSETDDQLRDDLADDRDPDHVADVLFMAQAQLMHEAQMTRASLGLAPIIPLFTVIRGDAKGDDS